MTTTDLTFSYHVAAPSPHYGLAVLATNPEFLAQLVIVLVLVIMLSCFSKGLGASPLTRRNQGEQHSLDGLKQTQQQTERSLMEPVTAAWSGIPKEQRLNYASERLLKGIDYAIQRHDWYEDQRSKIFQAMVALSSAIFVIAGWLVSGRTAEANLIMLFGFVSIAFLCLIVGVYYYNSELDTERPYRLVSDIRLWFFKYNISLDKMYGFRRVDRITLAAQVLSERKKFFERLVPSLESPNAIREDLEQLFILQILQNHKSISLKKMRWALSYIAVAFGVQIVMWFGFSIFLR
jgi:elongation factor P hydroxylase